MLKNYLKTAWRQIKKQKIFSLINLSSLVIGITSGFLILLYVQHEMNYDQSQKNGDRIVRLAQWFKPDATTLNHFARCVNAWQPWVKTLRDEYPEIKNIARLTRRQGTTLQINKHLFSEKFFFFTDPQVFDVFTIPLSGGDAQTALNSPNTVIISESMAQKYIDGPALGQTLNVIDGQGKKTPYKVTGIMKDWPDDSHMQINFLASTAEQELSQDWAYTYLLLNRAADFESLQQKLPGFVQEQFGEQAASNSGFQLQRLRDIHLKSHLDRELKVNGDINTVYVLWAVAILIIIIACINFINLTTAQALKRGREVGIKKTVGSSRGQLILQFVTEYLVLGLLAFIFSFLLIRWLLGPLNVLTNKSIQFSSLWQGPLIVPLFGAGLLICIIACIYPAFRLSKFKPLEALNTKTITNTNSAVKSTFRNVLVTIQFAIAAILLSCTFVFREQLQYLNNKPLGMNKEQVVSIGKNIPQTTRAQYQRFKQRLSIQNNVVNVSACMEEPFYEVKDIGECYIESKFEGEQKAYLFILPVDENFLDVLDIKLLAGKSFPEHQLDYDALTFTPSAGFLTDINEARRFYIINETALHHIGWNSADEALGKQMDWHNSVLDLQHGPIIGVVKDFHFSTLHKKVKPFVLVYEPHFFGSFLVKLSPNNMQQSVSDIEKIWQEMFPEVPFEFHFLDDLYADLYKAERQFNRVITLFTIMAITIGCLGLFGLVAYTAEQRTKEIGIRKVLGATVANVVGLLSSEFVKLVLVGNLIAWPLAYFAIKKWLENFAYRIDINWWIFALAGGVAMSIALFTVCWQAIRAAIANPVESLRYE